MKSFLLALLGLGGASLTAQAQWVNQPLSFADPASLAVHVQPVSAGTVWIVSDNFDVYAPPQLARTTDGGQTWAISNLPVRTSQKEYATGLSAVSPSLAWVVTVPADSTGSRIFRTTNGGQNWTVQGRGTTFTNPASYATFVHFFSATEGVVAGQPLPGSTSIELYRTADGGQSWAAVALPPIVPTENIVGQPTTYANCIWFMTDEGRVYRSADRGQTWAVSALPVNVEGTGLAFSDVQHGLLSVLNEGSTAHALFRTSDGGQTWAQVPYSGPLHGLGLAALPGSGMYVSTGGDLGNGDQGSSYSNDQGRTWVAIESTINHLFPRFLSASIGWSGSFRVAGTRLAGNGVYNIASNIILGSRAETATRAGWQVAPNPAAGGRTTLQAPQAFGAAAQVRVRDAVGRVVQQHRWNGGAPLALDLSRQGAGLYVVEVAGPAGSTYQKVQVR
ncbi:YCF48-related protein [Hymenobacter edaphi]|nr:YCF48-related protein [Hymenobacter edaphi]